MTKLNSFSGVTDRYYYVCCRDGQYRVNKKQRATSVTRPHQRPSRKLNATCISRMYANRFIDDHVEVIYIAAHTGHELGTCQLPFLPIPHSVKESVAIKLNQGILAERIMDGNAFEVNNNELYF